LCAARASILFILGGGLQLRRYIFFRAVLIVIWDALPLAVAACTFLFHTLVLNRSLTADKGYAAMALFDLLRFPLVVFPDMVSLTLRLLHSHPLYTLFNGLLLSKEINTTFILKGMVLT